MEFRTPAKGLSPADEARGRPLLDLALESIWHSEGMSRADLSRRLEVSRSTASQLAGDLLDTGLVAEGGDGPSRGGRRPILLEFQDDAHVILGVDMGATHVAVALTDLRGRILAWREEAHPVRSDPEGTRALMIRLSDEVLEQVPGATASLLGIGIAVASPVDHLDPSRLSETVLPAWKGRSGFETLQERYGVPVFVDNDANLGALAERWWGAGREVQHFTFIKLATGIGAGHMFGGQIYRGATNAAGEIGHISTDPHGEPCLCGNRGCLVTFIGGDALVRKAEALAANAPGSLLADGPITLGRIEEAALLHDPVAMQLVRDVAHHLGIAIAGFLNLLNPGAVILGGSMARLKDDLLVPLRETVVRRTLLTSVAASEVRVSELGPQGIALGAATLVLASALSTPTLFPAMQKLTADRS
ncbi:MAG: ROK family transcriptional regulator [Gemmatimonadales bacterium]|nr:MAG: ROK family transcriptional regulator [Gemmatimonadales bacterium]